MKLRVYQYSKCGTCRKALNFLAAKGIDFVAVPIRETPPTADELERMLERYGGQIRKLFNTSSQDYRNLNLKERLLTFTDAEAIALLAANGNLVRRPFVLTDNAGVVGFDEEEWQSFLSGRRTPNPSR